MPIHIFELQNEDSIIPDPNETFRKAAGEPDGAIVLIDELDRIYNINKQIDRRLMELLDGVDNQHKILVIATSNETFSSRDSLVRPGRFDRVFRMGLPCGEERKEILRFYLQKHQKELSENEYSLLEKLTHGCTGAAIAAVVEDACLRANEKPLTYETLETSFSIIVSRELPTCTQNAEPSFSTCVHEAGHAAVIDFYREGYELIYASVRSGVERKGVCICAGRENADPRQNLLLQGIDVGLAGFLAVKLILKAQDNGAEKDLTEAKEDAIKLISSMGYCGVGSVQHSYDAYSGESWISNARVERLAAKLLRRRARVVWQYLKANREKVLTLARELQCRRTLNGTQVHEMMKENTPKASKAAARCAAEKETAADDLLHFGSARLLLQIPADVEANRVLRARHTVHSRGRGGPRRTRD